MSVADKDAIPDEVRRFILLAIPSVPCLEAMLLLRSAPGFGWDAGQVARRLYSSDQAAQGLLDHLHGAGVATVDGASYRYAPQTEQLRTMIDQVAAIYSHNLIGVTNLIHSTTSRKARQFADAFVLRK